MRGRWSCMRCRDRRAAILCISLARGTKTDFLNCHPPNLSCNRWLHRRSWRCYTKGSWSLRERLGQRSTSGSVSVDHQSPLFLFTTALSSLGRSERYAGRGRALIGRRGDWGFLERSRYLKECCLVPLRESTSCISLWIWLLWLARGWQCKRYKRPTWGLEPWERLSDAHRLTDSWAYAWPPASPRWSARASGLPADPQHCAGSLRCRIWSFN